MISVTEALEQLFALAKPLRTEVVPLTAAFGRVLAEDVVAAVDQPPFDASAMDGYAVTGPAPEFRVIGEAAAGHAFDGALQPGEALRIFTGAPVPPGAGMVILQEDVTREGEVIRPRDGAFGARNIRPAGGDFRAGARVSAPRRLGPSEIALIAAMGAGQVRVHRSPEVALIATGDELVAPGEVAGPGQIPCSNSYGLHALLTSLGARPRLLPIARDRIAALDQAFALAEGADLIVTIGGASVGDHDLVAQAAARAGIALGFHKVRMRPGKPLMAGRRPGGPMLIGLPGNPVSAMVCGHVFLAPVIRALQGLPPAPAPRHGAPLAVALPPGGPREHYLRARLGPEGVAAFDRQDSSLLTVLAEADCLILQPEGDPARGIGEIVQILPL